MFCPTDVESVLETIPDKTKSPQRQQQQLPLHISTITWGPGQNRMVETDQRHLVGIEMPTYAVPTTLVISVQHGNMDKHTPNTEYS